MDGPEAASVDPGLPAPANLVADYWYRGWGAPRTDLSWDAVTAPNFREYELYRWNDSSFPGMITIFRALAAMAPQAQPYVTDFEYQVARSAQPGLTIPQREAIIEAMEADIDTLLRIMSETPGAGSLWNQFAALADLTAASRNNKYKDIYNVGQLNHYYVYAVLARYRNGDTSPPSNAEIIYAYDAEPVPPSQPTGFTATAYDPGVGLEWNPNPESDIAGYNVYLVQGGAAVKLNDGLVPSTSYFHDEGFAGATYEVVAVNVPGYSSAPASTVSVLAPATIYNADDPGWLYAGFWARENYVPYGGQVIRVARESGATASHAFNGRRIKLFCPTYWQSGDMRILVDGRDYGTYSLYSYDIVWGVQVFVVTGLSKGPHTITLECLGSGGPEGYHYVNFCYIEVR